MGYGRDLARRWSALVVAVLGAAAVIATLVGFALASLTWLGLPWWAWPAFALAVASLFLHVAQYQAWRDREKLRLTADACAAEADSARVAAEQELRALKEELEAIRRDHDTTKIKLTPKVAPFRDLWKDLPDSERLFIPDIECAFLEVENVGEELLANLVADLRFIPKPEHGLLDSSIREVDGIWSATTGRTFAMGGGACLPSLSPRNRCLLLIATAQPLNTAIVNRGRDESAALWYTVHQDDLVPRGPTPDAAVEAVFRRYVGIGPELEVTLGSGTWHVVRRYQLGSERTPSENLPVPTITELDPPAPSSSP